MVELSPEWADLDPSASFFSRPKGIVLGVDGSQDICLITSDYWAAKMKGNGFTNVKTAWVETISPYRYADGVPFKIGHKVAVGEKDGKTYVLDLPQTEFIEMGEGAWERTHSVANNTTHPEYSRLLGEIPMAEIAQFMADPQDRPNEDEVIDFLRAKGENIIATDQETGKSIPAGSPEEQGRYYDYEGTYKGFQFKIDDGQTLRVKTQSSLRTTQDVLRPRLVEVDPKKDLTSQYNKKVVAPKTPAVTTAVETSNPTTLPNEPAVKTAPAGNPVTSNQTPAAVAPSAPAAGATETAAAPQATKAPMSTVGLGGQADGGRKFRQEPAWKIENNAYSGSNSPLLAAITNPTNDILPYRPKGQAGNYNDKPNSSFEKNKISKKYPVVMDGKVFPSAEHAFFYFTKGEYNQSIKENIMSNVIAAKLQQHPELYDAIEKNGGRAWIETLNHYTGMGETGTSGPRDPFVSYWEGSGMQSGFVRALAEAFDRVKQMPAIAPKDQALVEWAQDKNNWADFPKADRGGKGGMMQARQNYFVQGEKPIVGPQTRQQEVGSAFRRMTDLAVGNTESSSAAVRLRRTIGASAPYGRFYDISTESRDIAQVDERLRGSDVQSIVNKLATEFGVPLKQTENLDRAKYSKIINEFLVSANKVIDLAGKKVQRQPIADVRFPTEIMANTGAKLSPVQAQEVMAVLKQISTTLSSYADPGTRIEAAGLRRKPTSTLERGTVQSGPQVVADLARAGINIPLDQVIGFDKTTADALGRSYGGESLFDPSNSSSNASATRPLIGMQIDRSGFTSIPEHGYTNPDQLAVDRMPGQFAAKIEYKPQFQALQTGKSFTGNTAANEAIATTIKYFPGLNPAISAPDGFSPVLDSEFGAAYQFDQPYHPDMANEDTQNPLHKRIYDLAVGEGDFKSLSQDEKGAFRGKIVSVAELAKPQHAALLDQILRDHTPGRITARRTNVAVSLSRVGPAAALVEGANPLSGEVDIATVVAELRKINEIAPASRTKEMNIRAKTLRTSLDGIKIFVNVGGPFASVPGIELLGDIVPTIRVRPRYKVLPGGAMLSQDGRYIDAFGFPKVEPYVFKEGKLQVVQKSINDEAGTRPFFPELAGGEVYKTTNPSVEQINAPEELGSAQTASAKPIESPTVQSPNKTTGFEIDNYQERMLFEASNKKKYPISENGAQFGRELDLNRFSRQDLAQEALKNYLIDQGDLLKASDSLNFLPGLRTRLRQLLISVDPTYAARSRIGSLAIDDITGGAMDRFNLAGGTERITAKFNRPTSSIRYSDLYEGSVHPSMKVFLNGLHQLVAIAREHAIAIGYGGSGRSMLPSNIAITEEDARAAILELSDRGKPRGLTTEQLTAAYADGIANAIDKVAVQLGSKYGVDYNAPVGETMPIIPDLTKRIQELTPAPEPSMIDENMGEYGSFDQGEPMPIDGENVPTQTTDKYLPVDEPMAAPTNAKPGAIDALSNEVALLLAGKLAPDERAALSKVLSGRVKTVPGGSIIEQIPGMKPAEVAAKIFADGWEKFSRGQIYEIGSILLPNGEFPQITLPGQRGPVTYDVVPGIAPGTGLEGDTQPAGLSLRVSSNQPKGALTGVKTGEEIFLTKSDQIKSVLKELRAIYQAADDHRLQNGLRAYANMFGKGSEITFERIVDTLDGMPGGKLTDLGPAMQSYQLLDRAIRGDSAGVRSYLESQIPPESVPTERLSAPASGQEDNTAEMLPSEDEVKAAQGENIQGEATKNPVIVEGKATDITPPRRRADAAMIKRYPTISAPFDFNAAASHVGIKASMGASFADAVSGFHKMNQAAFHGPVGFGAGAIADTAYLAAKGWLTPQSAAMSLGFNSLNLINPESLVKLGIPSKFGSKLGLAGAVAGLGLTAATGGDLGRGLATTLGGLAGGILGAGLGGFGAIGGSIAGAEAGDWIWGNVLGGDRSINPTQQSSAQAKLPRYVP